MQNKARSFSGFSFAKDRGGLHNRGYGGRGGQHGGRFKQVQIFSAHLRSNILDGWKAVSKQQNGTESSF